MENKEKNWNFHLVRDLSRVVCLRLALKAEFYIKTNKLKDVIYSCLASLTNID